MPSRRRLFGGTGFGPQGGFTLLAGPAGGLPSINDRTAVYDSTNGHVYTGWVDASGALRIYTFDARTHATVAAVTLASGLELHGDPALLIRNDGYVVASYSPHDGTHLYEFTSSTAHDAGAFGSAADLTSQVGGTADYTYMYDAQLSAESNKRYKFYREFVSGDRGYVSVTTSTDGGATWSTRARLLKAIAPTNDVIYFRVAYDTAKIHLFHTDTDRSDANPSALYHRYYDSGDGLWHKSDGTTVSSTDPTTSTLIHDASLGPISPMGPGIDATGAPFVSYNIYKSGSTSSDYYVATYQSGSWVNDFVVNNGGLASGHRTMANICVDPASPNQAVCLVKTGTYHEAFLYQRSGLAGAWGIAKQLTSGGSSYAMGAQGVWGAPGGLLFLWARGTWTTDSSYSVGMEGWGA